MSDRDWGAVFSATFSTPASVVQSRIWEQVFADEYPADLDTSSFVTKSALARFERDLGRQPGMVLLDVGCGRGGTGLWVAARTGASLVGIDIAPSAVAEAQQRAAAAGMAGSARFAPGTSRHRSLTRQVWTP